MNTRRSLATVAILVASLTLSACTMMGPWAWPGGSTSSDQFTDTNNADLAFTMMMIPHHEQAVEMADLVLAKEGVDARVVDLAVQIKAAQGPEIELMQGWLDTWGVGTMSGMDHGGMMSEVDMAALESATGNEASRLFLTQMIVHHDGAIVMAQNELANGINPDVRALCVRIIESQTAEIVTMKQILETL
ncbi:MAG: DUF305 domain-containing protein [Rhodoglobus sp.]